jgi:hypothetical protein
MGKNKIKNPSNPKVLVDEINICNHELDELTEKYEEKRNEILNRISDLQSKIDRNNLEGKYIKHNNYYVFVESTERFADIYTAFRGIIIEYDNDIDNIINLSLYGWISLTQKEIKNLRIITKNLFLEILANAISSKIYSRLK